MGYKIEYVSRAGVVLKEIEIDADSAEVALYDAVGWEGGYSRTLGEEVKARLAGQAEDVTTGATASELEFARQLLKAWSNQTTVYLQTAYGLNGRRDKTLRTKITHYVNESESAIAVCWELIQEGAPDLEVRIKTLKSYTVAINDESGILAALQKRNANR